jgi:hypothetical protein
MRRPAQNVNHIATCLAIILAPENVRLNFFGKITPCGSARPAQPIAKSVVVELPAWKLKQDFF